MRQHVTEHGLGSVGDLALIRRGSGCFVDIVTWEGESEGVVGFAPGTGGINVGKVQKSRTELLPAR